MEQLTSLYKKNKFLHHAYALEGERHVVLEELKNFFEKTLEYSIQANPDYHEKDYETLGIDEARELGKLELKKSFSNSRKVFVLLIGEITREAQNALLKMFEEPNAGTHFFVILRSFESLLPTLRSRMQYIQCTGVYSNEVGGVGQDFLNSSLKDRFSIVNDIAESKDKNEAEKLLNSIEAVLSKEIGRKNYSKEIVFALDELALARDYLRDRSPSIKMILEHVSGILPHLGA
jgi:DNA polymerase III delta prime subunit